MLFQRVQVLFIAAQKGTHCEIIMSPEPEQIFWAVLGFMWVEFLWEAFLSYRQRKIYKV